MIRGFGLTRRGGSKGESNLLAPFRATQSHDLRLEGQVWHATGLDPYIVYTLDGAANHGALVIDLDIEVLEGRVYPRIYFHTRRGFSQPASELMRRTGSGHYRLYVFLASPCKMIRLDPAEAACSFRLRQFSVRRTGIATFAARTLRDGANQGEEKPKLSRLMKAVVGSPGTELEFAL